MLRLSKLLEKLNKHQGVDAVFIAGSYGINKATPHSDLDLIIILQKNDQNIRSLFTWIDGVFSDIFFFDIDDLNRISRKKVFTNGSMDAKMLSWLQKSDIVFDKSGKLTQLSKKRFQIRVSPDESFYFWQKINYNFVANKRYFGSRNKLYHQALELRLLYSVMELITGYLVLRNKPWEGEKVAVLYFKKHDPKFWRIFNRYVTSVTIEDKFKFYKQLVGLVFPKKGMLWSDNDSIFISQEEGSYKQQQILKRYWNKLAQ